MTWKINPGCELPPVNTPPGISDLLSSIAQEYAAQKALFLANPSVAIFQQKVSKAQDFVDKAQRQADQLKRYTDLAAKYADLLDTCPCADVWDEEATDIDVP